MQEIFVTAFALFAGLTQALQPLPAPRIEPVDICPDSYIQFILDPDLPLGFAARAKSGRYLYLADPITGTVIPYYWSKLRTEERADMLVGLFTNDEKGHLDVMPVFTEPGVYEFYFSDNHHTEPENAIYITRAVTYHAATDPFCNE